MTLIARHETTPACDEGAARETLRRQIATIQARLTDPAPNVTPARGPRVLSFDDLVAVRDRLLFAEAEQRSRRQATHLAADASGRLLQEMLADPRRHRYRRISLAQLGQPGCGVYRVVPRLGLVGLLADWWCVKLSSGCP